jgi:NhaP-type Na+/H+ or K+/H+ antiporter
MDTAIALVVGLVLGLFISVALEYTLVRRYGPHAANLYWACWCTMAAVITASHGSTVWSIINAAIAGWHWWQWWNRRGRKLAAKALGRVKNLGHRLVVVPQ